MDGLAFWLDRPIDLVHLMTVCGLILRQALDCFHIENGAALALHWSRLKRRGHKTNAILEKVEQDALSLPQAERAFLADRLLSSLNPVAEPAPGPKRLGRLKGN